MSERICSYASLAPLEALSTPSSFSHERSISPGENHSKDNIALPKGAPPTATSLRNPESLERSNVDSHQDPSLDKAINFNHIELLIHLTLNSDMFNLAVGFDDHHASLSIALKTGLESPYLLHQLLAFSARHLAYLHPQRSASYLHQAITLQTRAVSLFNAAWTEVDQSNCVAVLSFSSVLGHHLLADTLANRDPGGLEAFIAHYTQCVEMHRGIYTIALSAWPLLMESKLEPILTLSSNFTSRTPKGNHCQRARELVDGAEGLGDQGKEACRAAIRFLQVGFDAMLAEDEQTNRYQMIFSWTMLVPPEITGLITAKRPEVLVLLAYYALLLHYGRNMWQVGDAGVYMLGIIADYLGPKWNYWLEYPRERIAKSFA
jgi:hypothetical protein